MMRQTTLLFFAITLLLPTLVSCEEITPPPKADYTVETVTEYCTEDGNSLQLMYPAIAGYADKEAEQRVNAMIAAYAKEMYRQEELIAAENGGYTYTAAEVVVTLAAKGFLSGYIGGIITAENTGYRAYFAYTFNCDISRCVMYFPRDLITDYGRLRKWFEADRFTQNFGYTDLKEQILLTDMIAQYKTDYGIWPAVYFTKDSIGLLLEVIPLLDGYAGYTLPIRQAEKCLNTENPFIALFMREN